MQKYSLLFLKWRKSTKHIINISSDKNQNISSITNQLDYAIYFEFSQS